MLRKMSHWLHSNFLGLLLGCYAIATLLPELGLYIRKVHIKEFTIFSQEMQISLPMLMLSFLLFNAGLGVQFKECKHFLINAKLLIMGLLTNIFVPIVFIFLVSYGLKMWHHPDEVQSILVGLALIAAMPIAGSSTAWSQNSNGNMLLSLGLVLSTTFLSPITTPAALHSVAYMVQGNYAVSLHKIAENGTSMFLVLCVIIPSVLGIGVRTVIGEYHYGRVKPMLKVFNSLILMLLIYSNASTSLPEVLRQPDFGFLTAIVLIAFCLCSVSFFGGWLLSTVMKLDSSERVSLMFGLGMNNNGTGLVLASIAFSDYPRVLLPIIIYNLVQHLVAGGVDRWVIRRYELAV